jgi:hypothetical protein
MALLGTSVTTNATKLVVRIPAGCFWVDTRQNNAWNAFELLELEGEANQMWYTKIPLEVGDEYHVFRVI